MKRKGTSFLDFFGRQGVKGVQRVCTYAEGWIVDFKPQDIPNPVWEAVCGRQVPSLVEGMRWVYWIPMQGNHTLLVFLTDNNQPVWFYSDVIAGSGIDAEGLPWTDDLYLDVVAIAAENSESLWYVTDTEIIDKDELEEALQTGKVTPEQYAMAWAEARQLEKDLRQNTFPPLDIIRAYVSGTRLAPA